VLKEGYPLIGRTELRKLHNLIDETGRLEREPDAEPPKWFKRPLPLCPSNKKEADLGHSFDSFCWEKTHIVKNAQAIFYPIYDSILDIAGRVTFDGRWLELTGKPGFKCENWMCNFRRGIFNFEMLFAGNLLGVHETRIFRGLAHLRTLLLATSLEPESITPGMQDRVRLAGIAYLAFVTQGIRDQLFPADRLFSNYLIYLTCVFPRQFGTDPKKYCLNESEAEAAEGLWFKSGGHLLGQGCRGGGVGGLDTDLRNHLIRMCREYNMKQNFGKRRLAEKGNHREKGIGDVSKALRSGIFECDFRLTKDELAGTCLAAWLPEFLENEHDGQHLSWRPEFVETEHGRELHALVRDTRGDDDAWVRNEDFVSDSLPVVDGFIIRYRVTKVLLKKSTVTAEAFTGAHRKRSAAESADTDANHAAYLRETILEYQSTIERKQTSGADGAVRTCRPKTPKPTALTTAELDAIAALYLGDDADASVRTRAHEKIKACNDAPGAHAKLASFGSVGEKRSYVGWLMDTFPEVQKKEGSLHLFHEVTLTPGLTSDEFDAYGLVGEEAHEPEEEQNSEQSVLEQVDAGMHDGDANIAGAFNAVARARFSQTLNHGTGLDALMHIDGAGRRESPTNPGIMRVTRERRAPDPKEVDYSQPQSKKSDGSVAGGGKRGRKR
jgi:hypothetical protein